MTAVIESDCVTCLR